MEWSFYGRRTELDQLRAILGRNRWFFVKLSGRRRIGKTTLIQRALQGSGRNVLYLQVPDSGPAGVLSAVRDAFETFGVNGAKAPLPTSLSELATTVGTLEDAVIDRLFVLNTKRAEEEKAESPRAVIAQRQR